MWRIRVDIEGAWSSDGNRDVWSLGDEGLDRISCKILIRNLGLAVPSKTVNYVAFKGHVYLYIQSPWRFAFYKIYHLIRGIRMIVICRNQTFSFFASISTWSSAFICKPRTHPFLAPCLSQQDHMAPSGYSSSRSSGC